jgi:hypothetical protein
MVSVPDADSAKATAKIKGMPVEGTGNSTNAPVP